LNRFADLAAAGVPLAFGSDAPVTDLGPWAAVRAAVHPNAPDAGVRPVRAFAAHTEGGWQAAGRSAEGRLEVGAPATFAVWRTAPGSAAALPDLSPGVALPTCLATVRRGIAIHDAGLFG
jgi:predicted amidohydrolase YtcJ